MLSPGHRPASLTVVLRRATCDEISDPAWRCSAMKSIEEIGLKDVQAVYSGPEGDLWELIMGEQIHIGGFSSSMALAGKAGIGGGMSGIDLCCCNGAGMRFLVRFKNVARMRGVDATETVIKRGRQRCEEEGLAEKIRFTLADVCDSGLPDGEADFVWGEDAWCYVVDKAKLIAEAARLVKSGGMIAFTDWVEGPAGLTAEEARRYLTFMKFPNVQDLNGYSALLESHGCEVLVAEDTGQFAPHVDLYLSMLNMQLTYDALKIIGFDTELMGGMGQEMVFMQELAHAGKIAQGRIVARKK
jgi:SAM-dependent methyltransferase